MEASDNTPTAPTDSQPPNNPNGSDRHRYGEKPGDWIGPYKLMEVIGEGGFGTVWLAERREPMVQRVALKIIKPGMDSKAVIARFEQERQALAVMDHPNVAKVLDGGVTPTGRPYFVMEHVKGEPITTFADRNRLTLKQRLELFIPVCEAVQHAHLKGIIHRDIKPSNILVASVGDQTSTDAAATRGMLVKVIDFGVAKAISHTLTDKTIFTEQGQIIGTPEYMSPEQAEMGATDIDTRTDVYSLGVVLYELLCGTVPFESKSLRSAGYAEIQRIIREVDPPKPSTRLSTADDATGAAIAKARQQDRERIAGELRRELEWIPLKALRKDRRERYTTPSELADDVRRYLNGEPLEAGPESAGYRTWKLIRRHRRVLLASGAVAVSILAGVFGVAWQARVARAGWHAATVAAGEQRRLADSEKALRMQSEEQRDRLKRFAFEAAMKLRALKARRVYDGLRDWPVLGSDRGWRFAEITDADGSEDSSSPYLAVIDDRLRLGALLGPDEPVTIFERADRWVEAAALTKPPSVPKSSQLIAINEVSLAVATEDGQLFMWNRRDHLLPPRRYTIPLWAYAIDQSEDASVVGILSGEGAVHVLQTSTGEMTEYLALGMQGKSGALNPTNIAVGPGGDCLVAFGAGRLAVWTKTRPQVPSLIGSLGACDWMSVCFANRGEVVVAHASTKETDAWLTSDGTPVRLEATTNPTQFQVVKRPQ